MFFQSREETLQAIEQLGVSRCHYAAPGGPVAWPESTCDCKFGYTAVTARHSEKSGCPELRSIHSVISAMSDEEWQKLVRRSEGIFISDITG